MLFELFQRSVVSALKALRLQGVGVHGFEKNSRGQLETDPGCRVETTG